MHQVTVYHEPLVISRPRDMLLHMPGLALMRLLKAVIIHWQGLFWIPELEGRQSSVRTTCHAPVDEERRPQGKIA